MYSFRGKEYEIIPNETYKIQRNCAGCGSKRIYYNTNRVRINANGKQIDVWVIYQCEKCKHTYNLSVYSRINRNTIDKAEYEALLRNDEKIISKYGVDKSLFHKNGAKILEELLYTLRPTGKIIKEDSIRINNPYNIRIRYDKLLSDCIGITRSKVKMMIESGDISINQFSDNIVMFEFH